MIPFISSARWLLTVPLLALPLLSFGQETRKVTKNYGPSTREVFYVLKSDKNVRHGSYEVRQGAGRQPVAAGYYRQGRKDSTWTEYARTGRVVLKGGFRDDKPVGVWSFYNENGVLQQQYDYTKHQVLLSRPEGSAGMLPVRLVVPTASGQKRPDIDPQYIGGQAAFLGGMMEFPRIGTPSFVNSNVQVVGTIGVDGKVTEWRLIPSGCGGCDSALLDMLKKLPNDWVPGEVEGKPVATEVLVSMKFYGPQRRM
ncbi:hypothetical protein [Hymenobacter cellulosivorans]|uniref:TonB C-terminal domain-containing protein n=1 Tax=Hymenobacter cellulosivorans TaxID=2932249 RepID=A0ABY4FA64_9BACT|nr:hypothetical protein [Hymenobacter cellulosivorans]UOQ53559.1 hypothetical protein MUN80_02090 [Hymenobacter cellulosivorans]